MVPPRWRNNRTHFTYSIDPYILRIMYRCERCKIECVVSYGTERFCSRACANTRERSLEVRLKISNSVKTCEAMREGRIQHKGVQHKKRTTLTCQICESTFDVTRNNLRRKFCSISCANKNPHLGGYRERSGRSKSGWYKGFYCGSTWELAFLIWALDMKLPIQRCVTRYQYKFGLKCRTYLPDFVINEFTVEIKGYDTDQTNAKLTQCKIANLIVLHKEDLQEIFAYVKKTYGNDYVELYEGNPYRMRNNTCKLCKKPAKVMYCSRQCAMKGNHCSKVIHVGAAPTPLG